MKSTMLYRTAFVLLALTWGMAVVAEDAATAEPAAAESAAPATEPAATAVTVTRDGDAYTVVADDAVMEDVLAELAVASQVDLEVDPSLMSTRVTLALAGVTYEKVVEALAGSHALIYERTETGGYRLSSARLTGRQDFIAPQLADLSRKEQRNVKALTSRTRKLLGENAAIVQDVGEMDYDQAKALVADRNAQRQAIVDQLAALGPGGARAMLEASQSDTGTRGKLALIEALAAIEDAEASVALATMYAEEDKYSLQRQIIGSLGHRKDAETEEMLTSMLDSTSDKRLRAGIVQALSGRPGALDELNKVATSSLEDDDVRAEALHAIGLTGGQEAQDMLMRVASDSSYDLSLRKAAIQQVERTFGPQSVALLETLLDSDEEGIRQSAVRALSRVDSPEALALLQATATTDVSSVIRAQAEAALSRRGATTTPPPSAN
jgi:HEAT repeat protein